MDDFQRGFFDELEKIAKEKIDPSFFEEHPVLTGFGPYITGVPLTVASNLASKHPKARGAIGAASGLASLLGIWGPIASQHERLSQHLTPQEMRHSKYFTVKHPIITGLFLGGLGGPGFYASASRKMLAEKGLLDE